MTLKFFDGFQESLQKSQWNGSFSGLGSQTGRDGSANGSAVIGGDVQRTLTPDSYAAATCILGFGLAIYRTDFPGGNSNKWPLLSFVRSGTTELVLFVNASGFIEARRTSATGTLLGTSSGHTAIAGSSVFTNWFHLQAKVVLSSTSGTVVVKYNGITVLNLTGVVTAGTSGNVTQIIVGAQTSSSQPFAIDDLWVCDGVDATATQGSPNNDFLGDLTVKTLVPTAAGDTTQWTPSTGSNWAAVDEVPANTTDYVSDGTSGHLDLYNLTDLPSTATKVYGVQMIGLASASDVGTINLKLAMKENSVQTDDATVLALSGTTWFNQIGAFYFTRPSDSGAWTVADANALQAGVKVA